MGESGISSWLSCSCAACCAWRRLGSLLRPCHANTDLKKYVIGLLRFAAADLSEFQDRVFPGVALAEVAPGVEKSEEKSESSGKEESPKKRSRSPSKKRKKSKESKGKQKALEKSLKEGEEKEASQESPEITEVFVQEKPPQRRRSSIRQSAGSWKSSEGGAE